MAQLYRVQGVPKTVVNDRIEIMGAVPEPRFVQQILEALDKGEKGQSRIESKSKAYEQQSLFPSVSWFSHVIVAPATPAFSN